MPYVIFLLCVIIIILVPPLWTVAAVLFAVLMLIGLLMVAGPYIFAALAVLALFLSWDLIFLQDRIYESLSERGGSATVSEIATDVGYAISNRENCAFATCRLYGELNDLLDEGDIEVFDIEGSKNSSVNDELQIVKLNKED